MTGTIPADIARTGLDPARQAELCAALARWLPRRRWFADKDKTLTRVLIMHAPCFTGPHSTRTGVLAVVRAEFGDEARPSDYLVPLAFGPARGARPGAEEALVARLGETEVTDALTEPGMAAELVRRVALGGSGGGGGGSGAGSGHGGRAGGDDNDDGGSGLVFVPEPPGFAPPEPDARERVLTVQQSNTSVVVDDRHLIKFFRRLAPGTNPELDAQRLLRAGDCPDVPRLEGAVHGPLGASTATYAVVQEFVPDAEDGWSVALRGARAALEGRADDFAGSMAELGAAVARVHAVLAAHGDIGALTPEVLRRLAGEMAGRLDEAVATAPELSGRRDGVADVYAALGEGRPRFGAIVQRVHGDLHLGQVLRRGRRWYVVDFEGEPAAAFARRTALHPPERDVAGMLRSIEYAAEYEARSGGAVGTDAREAAGWAERAARAFLSGYHAAAGLGLDEALLAAYQTDTAVYEFCYERRNRPCWAAIPLSGLDRLLADVRPRTAVLTGAATSAECVQRSVCAST